MQSAGSPLVSPGAERLVCIRQVDRQNFDARRVYDRLGYRIVYLQPRTDPRKGPLGANLFLRKDFGSEPPPPVD